MNTTLEIPAPERVVENFDAVINHYVRKTDILHSIVDGTPAIALCGKSVTARAQEGESGSVSSSRARNCEECDSRFERLPT